MTDFRGIIEKLSSGKRIKVFSIFLKDWIYLDKASIEYNPAYRNKFSGDKRENNPRVMLCLAELKKWNYIETRKKSKEVNKPSEYRINLPNLLFGFITWRLGLINSFPEKEKLLSKKLITPKVISNWKKNGLKFLEDFFSDEDIRNFFVKFFKEYEGVFPFLQFIADEMFIFSDYYDLSNAPIDSDKRRIFDKLKSKDLSSYPLFDRKKDVYLYPILRVVASQRTQEILGSIV
jgi:hypothetical protein